MSDAPIGPHVFSVLTRFLGARANGTKRGTPHTRLHSCRTHRTWTYIHFDDVSTRFAEGSGSFRGADVACDEWKVIANNRANLFDGFEHATLMSVGGIENDYIHTHGMKRCSIFGSRSGNTHSCTHEQVIVSVERGLENLVANSIVACEYAHQLAIRIDDRCAVDAL